MNGSLTDKFKLKIGLCQSDPISPFTYLLVFEGLNVIMNTLVEKLITRFGGRAHNNVYVSHLQLVDDTLLVWVKSRGMLEL